MKVFGLKIKAYLEAEDIKKVMDGLRLEAVQAVVGGEQEKLLRSKRRADREAMFRFGGQSGVGAYSLRSTTNQ